eukprot:EG_transcript_10285
MARRPDDLCDAAAEDSLRLETLPLLSPSYDDPSRRASVRATVFALVATMVGGSVLSLPWAVARAGLVPGLAALLLWALVGDFTVFVLLRCARRGGFTSYEEVAAAAFGPQMRVVVGAFTLLLCWMVTAGYLILAGDTAVLTYDAIRGGPPSPAGASSWAKALVAIVVLPIALARSLHSLRFTCVLSVITILLLALLLAYKAATSSTVPPHGLRPTPHYRLWPESPAGFLYTFSLFSGGYVCHFNVLAAHGELTLPTRGRVGSALHFTMLGCFAVYALIAGAGYLYAGSVVCDNVLLNFCPGDTLATVARLAMVVIVTANLPLIVFPARHALDGLLAALHAARRRRDATDPHAGWQASAGADRLATSPAARVWNTMALLGTAAALAIAAPGVHVVWTLLAGTVSMAVAYVLPPLMYLRLRPGSRWGWCKCGCVAVLIFSVTTSVLTTYQTVVQLGASSACPSGFVPCPLSHSLPPAP